MPSPSLFLGSSTTLLTILSLFSTASAAPQLAPRATTPSYSLLKEYSGSTFFDGFSFYDGADPTHGYVTYGNKDYAQSNNLIGFDGDYAVMKVDSKTTLTQTTGYYNNNNIGRKSVRIEGTTDFTHGLVITEIAQMPSGICGTWPAFWTLGRAQWPADGEIDIIEGANLQGGNWMSLHTGSSSSIDGSQGGASGSIASTDCNVNINSPNPNYTGCKFVDSDRSSYDSYGGGTWAMQWTSDGIKVWFWPGTSAPSDVKSGNPVPGSAGWGTPRSNFAPSSKLRADANFRNQRIIFDTTFCGDLGDATWSSSGCAAKTKSSSCAEYVAKNPGAFANAQWKVKYVKIFKEGAATTSTTTTSTKTTTSSSTTTKSTTTTTTSTKSTTTSSSTTKSTTTSSSTTKSTTSSSSTTKSTTTSSSTTKSTTSSSSTTKSTTTSSSTTKSTTSSSSTTKSTTSSASTTQSTTSSSSSSKATTSSSSTTKSSSTSSGSTKSTTSGSSATTSSTTKSTTTASTTSSSSSSKATTSSSSTTKATTSSSSTTKSTSGSTSSTSKLTSSSSSTTKATTSSSSSSSSKATTSSSSSTTKETSKVTTSTTSGKETTSTTSKERGPSSTTTTGEETTSTSSTRRERSTSTTTEEYTTTTSSDRGEQPTSTTSSEEYTTSTTSTWTGPYPGPSDSWTTSSTTKKTPANEWQTLTTTSSSTTKSKDPEVWQTWSSTTTTTKRPGGFYPGKDKGMDGDDDEWVTTTVTDTITVPCTTAPGYETITTVYVTKVPAHPDAASTWMAWSSTTKKPVDPAQTWASWTDSDSKPVDPASTWAAWSTADGSYDKPADPASTWVAWPTTDKDGKPVAASSTATGTWASWTGAVISVTVHPVPASTGSWSAWSTASIPADGDKNKVSASSSVVWNTWASGSSTAPAASSTATAWQDANVKAYKGAAATTGVNLNVVVALMAGIAVFVL